MCVLKTKRLCSSRIAIISEKSEYVSTERENRTGELIIWAKGTIGIRNKLGKYVVVKYWCKHFEDPSETYGIDGGRISKLTLKQENEIVYNYDRGLDITPKTEEAEQVLTILIHEYN